jgi:hypothetical protein
LAHQDTSVLAAIGVLKPEKETTMKRVHAKAILVAMLLLVAIVGLTAASESFAAGKTYAGLQKISDSQRGVTVEVGPKDIVPNKAVRFDVTLSTHSVELGFDLTKIATLEDGKGNVLTPTGWEGSPPGGHHRTGVLSFPPLGDGVTTITLRLKGIADVPERVFAWQLK